MSLAGADTPWSLRLHLAAVVGLYVVGVTWFARKEAETSRTAALRGAAAVMLATLALAVALPVPLHRPPGAASALFPYLLVAFGFGAGRPVWRAIRRPGRGAGGRQDSGAGAGGAGRGAGRGPGGCGGLLVLLLLPPALGLGKWVYST
jgi:hypothetical protein